MKHFLPFATGLLALLSTLLAQEKIILREDFPGLGQKFEVSPDGSKIYFAADSMKYAVFDAGGKLIDRIGSGGAPREIVPLPDGWFVVANAHAGGHIALYRPDGTEAKKVVQRGTSR